MKNFYYNFVKNEMEFVLEANEYRKRGGNINVKFFKGDNGDIYLREEDEENDVDYGKCQNRYPEVCRFIREGGPCPCKVVYSHRANGYGTPIFSFIIKDCPDCKGNALVEWRDKESEGPVGERLHDIRKTDIKPYQIKRQLNVVKEIMDNLTKQINILTDQINTTID